MAVAVGVAVASADPVRRTPDTACRSRCRCRWCRARSRVGSSGPPVPSTAARSTALRSSRTLPGHEWCVSASSADGVMLTGWPSLVRGLPRRSGRASAGHVLGPLAQRRDVQPHHVEPVVEVGPELAALHRLLQRLGGRGDDAHVDLARLACRRPGGSRPPRARAAAWPAGRAAARRSRRGAACRRAATRRARPDRRWRR